MIKLVNKGNSIAQFVVYKGQQVICKQPGVEPGGTVGIPTDDTYQVVATTEFRNNIYTSAPITVKGSQGFLAEVRQSRAQNGYSFHVKTSSSSAPASLVFQKTSKNPVTFTIVKDNVPLQAIVVEDGFETVTLDISDTYTIYAVCDGVTTDTVVTTNPSATITLTPSNSWLESGYADLAAM